jgi:3-oxoacid CoA-transferase
MGGAMDLVGSNSRVIVTMTHVAKNGSPKILDECSFPLTGTRCVDMIITDKATFAVDKKRGGLTMTDIAPGLSVDDVRKITGCDFHVADDLQIMHDAQTLQQTLEMAA